MKKQIKLLITVICISTMVSCGNGSSKQNDGALDSIRVADSIKTVQDSIAKVKAKAEADSIALAEEHAKWSGTYSLVITNSEVEPYVLDLVINSDNQDYKGTLDMTEEYSSYSYNFTAHIENNALIITPTDGEHKYMEMIDDDDDFYYDDKTEKVKKSDLLPMTLNYKDGKYTLKYKYFDSTLISVLKKSK